jgi:hypothetical protein
MRRGVRGGENFNVHIPKPVTLPTVELDDIDIEREAKEAAERVRCRRCNGRGRGERYAVWSPFRLSGLRRSLRSGRNERE